MYRRTQLIRAAPKLSYRLRQYASVTARYGNGTSCRDVPKGTCRRIKKLRSASLGASCLLHAFICLLATRHQEERDTGGSCDFGIEMVVFTAVVLFSHPFTKMKVGEIPAAAAAAAAALLFGGVRLVDPIFGVYGSTADQLETLLDLDEAPPALVGLVRIGRPLYEPLKAVSSSCTEGIYPEFNDDLDMNDCLLLPNRLFWREAGGRPLLIRQTMGRGSMWETSTGSSVWGGGIVLQRYLEQELGRAALAGKRVIELGTGTGLGAITAASLGAGEVLAIRVVTLASDGL